MSEPRSIINTYDQLVTAMKAGHKWPFAICAKSGGIRFDGPISQWSVYHPTQQTDADTAWHDRGQKAFRLRGMPGNSRTERKAAALAAAQQWVKDTYGYSGEWKRNRMGDYIPADIQKQWPIPKRT